MKKIKIKERRILSLLNKKSFKSLSKYTGTEITVVDEEKTLFTKTTTISVTGSNQGKNRLLEILGELKSMVQHEVIDSQNSLEMDSSESMFVIKSDEGFWSNEYGWVDSLSLCTLFDANEKDKYDLPIGNNVRPVPVNI